MGHALGLFSCLGLLGTTGPAYGAWNMHPPKAPLPGQSQSCQAPPLPATDFSSDCENCRDLELVKCDIYLGSDEMGNKMVFTVKNHNTKFPRRSDSARFGHVGATLSVGAGASTSSATSTATSVAPAAVPVAVVGDAPVAPPAAGPIPASAPVATATAVTASVQTNVSLEIPSAETPHYTGPLDDYPAAQTGAYSEAMPDAFSLDPGESRTYEVDSITDFPIIAACSDIVYMAVNQRGVLETPYLWNRNYSCTILPCEELGFRRCAVHRGNSGGGAAPKAAAPSTPDTVVSQPGLKM